MDVNELETIVVNLECKANQYKAEMAAAHGNIDKWVKANDKLHAVQDKITKVHEDAARRIVKSHQTISEGLEKELELLERLKSKGTYIENYAKTWDRLADSIKKAKKAEAGGGGSGSLGGMFPGGMGGGIGRLISGATLTYMAIHVARQFAEHAFQNFTGGPAFEAANRSGALADRVMEARRNAVENREDNARHLEGGDNFEKRIELATPNVAKRQAEAATARKKANTVAEILQEYQTSARGLNNKVMESTFGVPDLERKELESKRDVAEKEAGRKGDIGEAAQKELDGIVQERLLHVQALVKGLEDQATAYGKTAHQARMLKEAEKGLTPEQLRDVKAASLHEQSKRISHMLETQQEAIDNVNATPGQRAAFEMGKAGGSMLEQRKASSLATTIYKEDTLKHLKDQAETYGLTAHEVTMLTAAKVGLVDIELKDVEVRSKAGDLKMGLQDIKKMTEHVEEQKKAILDSTYVLAPYLDLLKKFHNPVDRAKAEEAIKKNVLGERGAHLEKEMQNPKERFEERMKELNAIFEASDKGAKAQETFSRAANKARKEMEGPSSSFGVKAIRADSVEAADFIQRAHDQIMQSRTVLPDSMQTDTQQTDTPAPMTRQQRIQAEKQKARAAWAAGIAARKAGAKGKGDVEGLLAKGRMIGNANEKLLDDLRGGGEKGKDESVDKNTLALQTLTEKIGELYASGISIPVVGLESAF